MNGQRPFILLTVLLAACGGAPEKPGPHVSREPISVRGWITDVDAGPVTTYHTVETDAARKRELFQATNVWIENAPYVSGGVAETGAFLLLDVPPGNVTITFSAPGAPAARLVLQNVPGNADVFVPSILLKKDSIALLDPASVKVRLAAPVDKESQSGAFANVGGQGFPVMRTPIVKMIDRLDYPFPPASQKPLATVR